MLRSSMDSGGISGHSQLRAGEADRMTDETVKIEVNARVYVLGEELAASLLAARVVYQCLSCDPSGLAYHLDPHHTVKELLALGAHEWRWQRPDASREPDYRRIPALFVHHLA
jgi:hypothetical protein